MSNDLISIVIPTYNRQSLLKLTLNSVQQQDYKNWECIIVDDFSTDNTKETVEEFIKNDSRIRYTNNERKKGAQGARNTGIIHSNGEYIACFDSDNTMRPNFLSSLYDKIITSNATVATCYLTITDRLTEKEIGKHIWNSEGNIHSKLLTGETYVDYNCAIIKKELLEQIGLTDEDCPSFQEWDTHLRLSKIATYSTVQKELAYYYVNGADAISSDKKREVNGYLYILNKHKQDWQKYKKAFIHYGKAVLQLLQTINDIDFRTAKTKELYNTINGLKTSIILQKIKYKILWLKLLKKKVLNWL